MPIVERPGARIHYVDKGQGPAVLLGHSFLCSSEMWRAQSSALADRYRLIALDYRGHGASVPPVRPYTLWDLVDDSVAVLDHAGVDQAVWVGLSMGGMVALRAALAVPERVRGLILVDTDAGRETPRVRLKHQALATLAGVVGTRRLVPAINRLMFGETSLRDRPALVAEWGERFAAPTLPSIRLGLGAIDGREPLRDRLSGLRVPALVIAGREDRALPVERSQALAAQLPTARLHILEGCGHLAALECPDEVTRLMAAFLAELP